MIPTAGAGNPKRRPPLRRKFKSVVYLFYLFIVIVAASMSFFLFTIHSQLESTSSSENLAGGDGGGMGSFLSGQQQPKQEKKQQRKQEPQSNCAILLFGLPRAFKDFVLPSMETNVIRPNVRYGCDYFVHYYQQNSEAAGRSGSGGAIRSEDIFLLRDAVTTIHKAHHKNTTKTTATAMPEVTFVSDTNETFWKKRENSIQHYRTAKNPDGNYSFYPYGERTYEYPGTLDNIVRQWHSINAVWDAMEDASSRKHSTLHQYRRVAMMRNDVIYLTPIDIYSIPVPVQQYQTSKNANNNGATPTRTDYSQNTVSVIPDFAKWPVNDRLIYGPYSAVKIWASQRFAKIEEYSKDPKATPGMVMHSETFLNASILQTIKDTKVTYESAVVDENKKRRLPTNRTNELARKLSVLEDKTMCFLRVRADGAIWIEDCDASKSGFGGGYPGGEKAYTKLLRKFLPHGGKGCKRRKVKDKVRKIIELACPPVGESTPK